MAINLFGFTIKRKDEDKPLLPSVVPPGRDDGSIVVGAGGGHYAYTYDVEGQAQNELDLIRRYRSITNVPEVDEAITQIVDEALVFDTDEKIIELNLEELKVGEPIKKKFQDAFDEVLNLLEFETKGADYFRSWYVDGRLPFHILMDLERQKEGIQELRYIDPRKIRKVKEIKKSRNAKGVEVIEKTEEYYLFNDRGIGQSGVQGIKLSTDSVAYCHSGIIDGETGMVLGFLHKAIRPANQLRMMEDALVIYRLSRAPERRIFYIDVGNLPKGKAEQYVNDMMNKFRNKLVYDATTGEIADSKRHQCLSMDTKVPLLDGRTLTLSEISAEFESGKTLWVYSCDPVTGKFEPGLVSWAGVTRKNAEVLRITLDNGKTITCTPDHKFPVWNKGFVRADELSVGESMIPHYSRKEKVNKKATSSEYEQIFNNDSKKWEFTHRLVSKWKDDRGLPNEQTFSPLYSDSKKTTVHHYDFNPANNNPENLMKMNRYDHILLHGVLGTRGGKIGGRIAKEQGKGYFNKNHPKYHEWHVNAGKVAGKRSFELGYSLLHYAIARERLAEKMKDPSWNESFREKQRAGWTEEHKARHSVHAKRNNLSAKGNTAKSAAYKDPNSSLRKNHTTKYKTEYTESILNAVFSLAQRQLTSKEILFELNSNAELIEEFKQINSCKVMGKQKDYSKFVKEDFHRIVGTLGFCTFTQLKEAALYRNHKIVKIEKLEERIDTGCLTVDQDHIYHSHHTFALDAGIYTRNSIMEDFWMPRRGDGKGTQIDTLPGGQNLSQIEDIEYFQNKLLRSLNVPQARLRPETGFTIGRPQETSREEVAFNKYINRLRTKFNSLFLDLLRVQLIAKGVLTHEGWEEVRSKIKFDYQKDNHFSELKDSEILNNRLASLQAVDQFVGKYYSKAWVQKNVLHLNEEEIEAIEKEIEAEAPSQEELAQTQDQEQNQSQQGNENESEPA